MGINKNFVVRNGLEVANTLLYANDETKKQSHNTSDTVLPQPTSICGVAVPDELYKSLEGSGIFGSNMNS